VNDASADIGIIASLVKRASLLSRMDINELIEAVSSHEAGCEEIAYTALVPATGS